MRLVTTLFVAVTLMACGKVDDADTDAGGGSDAVASDASNQVCTPDAPLRCEGGDLISCNADGTGEETFSCPTGCNATDVACNSCVPNTVTCEADQLTVCDAAGMVDMDASGFCPLGCDAGGERCTDVDPSNDLAVYLEAAAAQPDLVLNGPAVFNTNSGTVTDDGNDVTVMSFDVSAPSGGVAVRVWVVGSLTANDTIRISGANAAAIVSNGDVIFNGEVNASASFSFINGPIDGPGARTTASCSGNAGNGDTVVLSGGFVVTYASGGGGGGFASAGKKGGDLTGGVSFSGGSGGNSAGNATLVPLRGGCSGGAGGAGGAGGGGGGAIQVVSRTRIQVSSSGGIRAGGGGGQAPSFQGGAGGGGGSGGGILLEAPIVAVGGTVAANGGGGGCGSQSGSTGGLDGLRAAGGNCTGSLGDGGGGGALQGAAQVGETVAGAQANSAGGGGGGSEGRVRINTGTDGFTGSGTVSPAPSLGDIGTR